MYKDIGQNFLKNKKTIKKIIKCIKPKKKQNFLEIGCGNGEITKEIFKYNKNIITTEIDKNLFSKTKKNIKNIKILNINFLKIKFLNYFKNKIRIIGNIPYYISHKIIIKLIKNNKLIKDIHILVQKEFAYNLIEKEGKKKYSKFTVLINIFFKIKILFNVNKNNFFPKPKVESIFLKLIPKKNEYNIKKIKYIIHILNNAFFKKKKKIINNLKIFISIKELKKININPSIRSFKLNYKKYIKIINLLIKKNKI